MREWIGEIKGRGDPVSLRDQVGREAAEALGQVSIGGQQGIVEDSEAGPQHGLVADSIGETDTRIPIVPVGLLGTPGVSVHPREDETADEVISGHAERRRTGSVEIDVVIGFLDTAELQVVPQAERQREVPAWLAIGPENSRHNTGGCSRVAD